MIHVYKDFHPKYPLNIKFDWYYHCDSSRASFLIPLLMLINDVMQFTYIGTKIGKN